ncbi:unnamed protein product [Schistocephalus solidus]|uniref:TGT domain-containing protein n=1 Tax=Schistocephalus solidus TaxID=70667 RepID=A0A183TKB5_SCHSO|nr:unnamed protein product [Schistocephalus solidus]
MRFSTGVSGAAPRIGLISEVAANFGDFQTPNCLLYTKFGKLLFGVFMFQQKYSVNRREKHIVHTSFGKGLAKLSGLRVLAGIPMLVSVTGGNDLDQRLRGLAKTDFSVVLDGFFLDCIDESNQPMDRRPHLDCMFEVLPKLCLQLPSHLPRILTNIWQPDEVARAVTCGVDIFDGTLPFRLSRSGLAWLYPGWMPHSAATTTSRQTPFPSWIAFPLDKELLKGSSGSVFNQPLQEGCSCFTCQRHNRGYISHLHSVNEMLAHILLMIHNSTRCYRFFSDLRAAVKNDQMEDFLEFCKGHHFPEQIVRVDLTANSMQCDDS